MLERVISQTKALKTISFLLFNFSVTNICVEIRLAEDGTRMGGILFQQSPSLYIFIHLIYCAMTIYISFILSINQEFLLLLKLLKKHSIFHNRIVNYGFSLSRWMFQKLFIEFLFPIAFTNLGFNI